MTDSALTYHGVFQTQKLGKHLVTSRKLRFTHIFSSDLTRAAMTADAILDAHKASFHRGEFQVERVKLSILREQDFGSFECMPWSSRQLACKVSQPGDPDFRPKETTEAMSTRMDLFLDNYLLQLMVTDAQNEHIVAIVSHGIILSTLWKALLLRFGPQTVSIASEVGGKTASRPLEHLPGWSNTGYLELHLFRAPKSPDGSALTKDALETLAILESQPKKLVGWKMVVEAVNAKQHLSNIKRARGGLGSATYDPQQKKLEGFFSRREKKQKT